MIDSLHPGGAERAAVLIANALEGERYAAHLATTRTEGSLASSVRPAVRRLRLARRHRFDAAALLRLAGYLRRERIRIVHAHNTALFLGAAACRLVPGVSLVWHDHFGTTGLETRSAWLWGLAARRAGAIIAVNGELADWSRRELGVPASRIHTIPNFVPDPGEIAPAVGLPGHAPIRIVCVANLRPQKDHETLLAAMASIARRRADVDLLLVGRAPDPAAAQVLGAAIARHGLSGRVFWLGERDDVAAILRAGQIGVLASRSEGLPLCLLEYGMAGLPVVATDVGACRIVLDDGRAGTLVAPGDPAALAGALTALLDDPVRQARLGAALRQRVATEFSEEAIVDRIQRVYDALLAEGSRAGAAGASGFPAGAASRIGIVGPFVDGFSGWVRTPGQQLADALRETGWDVLTVSHARGRLRRLLDVARTLAWRGRRLGAIVVMTYGGPSFVIEETASAIARLLRRPVVLHLHGGNLPRFFARFPGWSRRVLRRAGRIVVPSPYLGRAVDALGFRSEVIPNAVRISAYPFRARGRVAPRLLWIRTFHPIYDPEMALEVLRRVRESHPEATLVMAGQEKGLGEAVRRIARDLGLQDAIRFPGFLEEEGKRREAEGADIFLNTSRVDNQPVTVIEACAFGLPVVSTAVGGVPDLLRHEETGLLVPAGDAAAMARAVLRLVAEPPLAARLSRNGRSLAESFDVSAVRPRWERLLSEVSKAPPGGLG